MFKEGDMYVLLYLVMTEKVLLLIFVEVKSGFILHRYASCKKAEGIYVKYVRARESCQSTVLLLSRALKDKRFNLQVKVGIRDAEIIVRQIGRERKTEDREKQLE